MFLLAIISVLCTSGVSGDDVSLQQVRAIYSEATDSKSQCENLLEVLPPYGDTNNETLKAYRASATMIMAKHAWTPMTKVSYFKEGKKHLQLTIQADPSNLEIRYLRFTIQSESPAFLGYNDEITEDKIMLLDAISNISDKELRKMIAQYLKASDELTPEEKQRIIL